MNSTQNKIAPISDISTVPNYDNSDPEVECLGAQIFNQCFQVKVYDNISRNRYRFVTKSGEWLLTRNEKKRRVENFCARKKI